MSRATELLKQATPLPWEGHGDGYIARGNGRIGLTARAFGEDEVANAALIVYAVNRLPDYEAAVEALERLVEVLGPATIKWTDPVPADSQFALTNAREALARLRDEVTA